MNFQGKLSLLTICCQLLTFIACAAVPGVNGLRSSLSVEVIGASQTCLPPAEGWTATLISTQDQLRKMVEKCHAHLVGAAPKKAPAIDFDRSRVLAVEMGEQPSAGFGMDVINVTVQGKDQPAVIELAVHQPLPGTVTAQVVTSPCILIRLPIGAYQGIEVVDQKGLRLVQIP